MRKNIVPAALKRNPNMLNNLTTSMNLQAAENALIRKLTEQVFAKYITITNDSFEVSTGILNEEEVLQRRAVYSAFKQIFPDNVRINNASIKSVLQAAKSADSKDNIQQDYAVHSTKKTVFVEPMQRWQKRRKRL